VTAVITDHDEIILSVVARRLPSLNVNAGEVNVALLAVETAVNLSLIFNQLVIFTFTRVS
jgi:hypothetical protein